MPPSESAAVGMRPLRARPGFWARLARHQATIHDHFDSFEQQRNAATFGMWVFLVTEVLFFGVLFVAYTVYRYLHPTEFLVASLKLDVPIGTANTAILITSSLTMALAVRAAALGKGRWAALFLAGTLVLGAVFLGFKLYEYWHKWEEHLIPGHGFHMEGVDSAAAQVYFCMYFGMTGLHALHMIVGILLILGTLIPAWLGWFGPANHNWVEGLGLYWHFVDIVWIFLYPLLYLMGRHVT